MLGLKIVRKKTLDEEYVITEAGIKARLPLNFYDYYGIPKSRRGYVPMCLLGETLATLSDRIVPDRRCMFCNNDLTIVVWIRWLNAWLRCPRCLKAIAKYRRKASP